MVSSGSWALPTKRAHTSAPSDRALCRYALPTPLRHTIELAASSTATPPATAAERNEAPIRRAFAATRQICSRRRQPAIGSEQRTRQAAANTSQEAGVLSRLPSCARSSLPRILAAHITIADRGYCARGDHCTFIHDEMPYPATPTMPTAFSTPMQGAFSAQPLPPQQCVNLHYAPE